MSGQVAVTWLGQAGYSIQEPGGDVLLVDPYLSHWVEEELGMKRIAPIPVEPKAARASAVVVTHWHPDHLDRRTLVELAEADGQVGFLGPPSIAPRLAGWGVAPERIRELGTGSSVSAGPFTVHGVYARHEVPGFLTEDAIGLVIEVAGVRIYHSGDTEYDARLRDVSAFGPFDLGLFVSNGSGGNMNVLEAALLAHQLDPRLAVPNHYGMWADDGYGPGATLDPDVFATTCAKLGGPPTRVLELGETVALDSP
jgi:L-ascorbate metabolism protein UlaG (beta-lactamase superfamily)